MWDEIWLRWIAVSEMLLLVTAGIYWLFGLRPHMPSPMFSIGVAYGSVLVAFALVIVLNMVAHVPPSPGLVIGVILIAGPVGFVLWKTAAAIRDSSRN